MSRNGVRRIVTLVAATTLLGTATASVVADTVAQDQIMVRLEGLSDSGLKAFYLHCSRAAAKRSLGSGGIAVCSIGYELLLRRTFGGDFNALLAWWRLHPGDGAVGEFEDGELIESELPRPLP